MSRKVLILANVGNNDVKYVGERTDFPAKDGRGQFQARFAGEWILENYEDVSKDLILPIVSKGIAYIESLKEKYGEVLGRGEYAPTVELFCTDQSPPHSKDTAAFAEIIRRDLPGLFPNRKDRDLRLKEPVTVNTARLNPAPYDDMYNFFEEVFELKAPDWKPEETLCFVLTSGGTPAMNMALILHAVQYFGENCVQVYIPDKGEPSELRIGEEIVRADIERRFNEALDACQFRSAAVMLEDTSRGSYEPYVCRYAERRLAFDFRRAVDCCGEAIRAAPQGDSKRFLESHRRHTVKLAQGGADLDNRALLIEELFYNLEVKWVCGEYVDFLGRLFRLQEALLGWVVQTETDIKTDEDKVIEDDETLSVKGLSEYVREKFPHGTKVNRYSMTVVTGYLVKPEAGLPAERREWVTKVRKGANKVYKLADLRNPSILGHGFEGVSKEDIDRVYGSETLIGDLRSLMRDALGRDLSTNLFVELAEKLKL